MASTSSMPLEQPASLWTQALTFISEHLDVITTEDSIGRSKRRTLRKGVYLTASIADALLEKFHEKHQAINDHILNIFCDTDKCRLQRINLLKSSLCDKTFACLMRHEPLEVNIKGCQNLTTSSLISINQYGKHLVSLSLGFYWNIFSDLDLQNDGERNGDELRELMKTGLMLPNLRHLNIRNLTCLWQDNDILLSWILSPMQGLSSLDLSDSEVVFEECHNIENLVNLRRLCLHGVVIKDIHNACKVICKLKQLRALDLSYTLRDKIAKIDGEQAAMYLYLLVENLKLLEYLDLSGTCLVGKDPNEPYKEEQGGSEPALCSIPGLEARQTSPFQLLGLMDCRDACARKHLPAIQVTGIDNEEQVLLSLSVYMECPRLLKNALNALVFLVKYIRINDLPRALKLTLMALNTGSPDVDLLCDGLICLIHLTKKGLKGKELNFSQKRKIITTLLNCLEQHPSVEHVLIRAWPCLTYFKLPDELLFVYSRVMQCGANTLKRPGDANLHNVILYVMKHLSSQVDIQYKVIAGDIGIVRDMLNIVRRQATLNAALNNTMLRAWSVLWSLTDLAPSNSELFINENGLDVFLLCLRVYPDEPSLTMKMMGMMCNVAEVAALRPHLMKEKFLRAFCEMFSMDLNISNSACGVMAYMLGDGPDKWAVQEIIRERVVEEMRSVIAGWDLTAKRNVRYRSFIPMMELLKCFATPVVQYWAAWEVCNMTNKDPSRYCPMLKEEQGIDLVRQLQDDPRTEPHICELLHKIIAIYNSQM